MSINEEYQRVLAASQELDKLLGQCRHTHTEFIHRTLEVTPGHRHDISGVFCHDCQDWMVSTDNLEAEKAREHEAEPDNDDLL